jgi:hypothetical protein
MNPSVVTLAEREASIGSDGGGRWGGGGEEGSDRWRGILIFLHASYVLANSSCRRNGWKG